MQFTRKPLACDVDAINDTIQRALAAAGLDTTSGPMRGVTETIRQALGGGRAPVAGASPASNDSVIDVNARVVDLGDEPTPDVAAPRLKAKVQAPGTFETHEFTNRAGSRCYKLYVPALVSVEPRPVVVMLHGCTQSADDFAAGTQMNRLADQHGFLVVYPEQPSHANMSKCWNWFKQQDQLRDAGEPSLIAGIALEVAEHHGADTRRIFVAGLSAGAAMAVVLGETYPDVFAGVGAHSGLPYGSAHDIPSAMAAMKGGRSGLPGLQATARAATKKAATAVPTIVFHGDRDHTVQLSNGEEIIKQATEAYVARSSDDALTPITQAGQASGGRSFSRTVLADSTGRAHMESWILHGAGHAWSGGDPRGSYTDGQGPDASAEMVRFFLALPRAGEA